jgi:hypothetical protein
MQAVKSSPSQAVQRTEPAKRTERQTKPDAQTQAATAKKAEEQTPPRATVNTRGEMVGRLLNVSA